MADVLSWISSTAFPALGSCWDFFKKCVVDLISYVTSSRLVFIFALFLIGTIISVIVFIVTSTPDVSDVDSSYPQFKFIKQRDLYYSGFNKPVTMFAKFHFKRKSEDIFKKSNLPYVTLGGYKFYNPNYKKSNVNKFKAMEHDYNRSQNNDIVSDNVNNSNRNENVKIFKAMERDYFRSQKSAPVKRSKANIDIEVD